MRWIFNDGGRADAGFRGDTGDCATRSIAIAAQLSYREVYDRINDLAKLERPRKRKRSNARLGVHSETAGRLLESLGFEWTPTMRIGQGTTVHLKDGELPDGRLVVRCSRHFTAVIDGVIYDTHDPSREGTRAVYGYWRSREQGPVVEDDLMTQSEARAEAERLRADGIACVAGPVPLGVWGGHEKGWTVYISNPYTKGEG